MPRETAKSPPALPLAELTAAILFCLAAVGPLWAADSSDWLQQRRQEVEAMTPAEKEDLNEKYQKFLSLPPQQQEQLRLLHQQLEIDPNGERLRSVMQRYYGWLKTLSPQQMDKLLAQTTDDQRLAMVKTLRQDQEARAAGAHMARKDVTAIFEWVKQFAANHQADLLKQSSMRHRPQSSPAGDQAMHDRTVPRAWRYLAGDRLPDLSQADIDDLAARLTAKPRKSIESKPTLHDKIVLVHGWLQGIFRARSIGFARQGMNIKPEVLAQFFATLPKDQQQKLLQIADQREQQRELRRLYFVSHRSSGFGRSGMYQRFNRPEATESEAEPAGKDSSQSKPAAANQSAQRSAPTEKNQPPADAGKK